MEDLLSVKDLTFRNSGLIMVKIITTIRNPSPQHMSFQITIIWTKHVGATHTKILFCRKQVNYKNLAWNKIPKNKSHAWKFQDETRHHVVFWRWKIQTVCFIIKPKIHISCIFYLKKVFWKNDDVIGSAPARVLSVLRVSNK